MTDPDQGSQGETVNFPNEGASAKKRRSRRSRKDSNAQPERAFVYSRDLGPGSKWKAKSDPGRKSSNSLFGVLAGVFIALLLIAGAFLLGKQVATPPALPSPQPEILKAVPSVVQPSASPAMVTSERREAMAKLEQGLEARAKGDLKVAQDLLQQAKDIDPTILGIRLLQARMAVGQRDFVTADGLLLKSIRAKENVVECLNLRGSLLSAQKAFREAYNCFSQAVDVEPLDPYAYFYWADALRGEGRPAEAAVKLEMAARLSVEQSDSFIIQAKLLLSKVEAEDENGAFAREIDEQAGKSGARGEVLLAAAALDLKRSNYPRAAERLELARQTLQPNFFFYLTSDPFFDFYRNRDAIKHLLGPPAPATASAESSPESQPAAQP